VNAEKGWVSMNGLHGKPAGDYEMARPFGILLMRGFVGSVHAHE